jgi:site-specific recombinase XerD
MPDELTPVSLTPQGSVPVSFAGRPFPNLIAAAGPAATRRFIEFFAANIRNRNTRAAYARAVGQFLDWAEKRHLDLKGIAPFHVAAYIEQLSDRATRGRLFIRKSQAGRRFQSHTATTALDAPSIKQHLAAIRMLFDWLVTGQIVPLNPAASVRGPKHVVKKGKTPVLSGEDARVLLDSIPLTRKISQEGGAVEIPDLVGLRDRALIATMVFSFARVSAVVGMEVEDYYQSGKRFWIRLHEKGGEFHEVAVHHNAEPYLDAYLTAASIKEAKKTPLFRAAVSRTDTLSDRPMSRTDALRMVKRRVAAAGLPNRVCCHTFRATGITAYLEAGGSIENAQAIAAHESPRTTKLYDRTNDEITLDEIEGIRI